MEAIDEATRLGTCDSFSTRDSLIAEFRRTIRGLRDKNYETTAKAVVNNIGGDWQKEPAKRPGSGGTYAEPYAEPRFGPSDAEIRRDAETHAEILAEQEARDKRQKGETNGEG